MSGQRRAKSPARHPLRGFVNNPRDHSDNRFRLSIWEVDTEITDVLSFNAHVERKGHADEGGQKGRGIRRDAGPHRVE